MVANRLVLIDHAGDAAARERAISLDCVVNHGIATRQQRKGLGICGDPDAMIRAGSGAEGAWHWSHSVYRNKRGQHREVPCV